jgi:hypothetical protein
VKLAPLRRKRSAISLTGHSIDQETFFCLYGKVILQLSMLLSPLPSPKPPYLIPKKNNGAALELMKSRKHSKSEKVCRDNGVKFIPMVVETLGGWDSEALSHLREFARRSCSRFGRPPSSVIRHFFQRLAIQLQRANASLIDCQGPPSPDSHVVGNF